MTEITAGLLPIGNGFNIKTYKENDAHINRKPISEVEILSIISVQANKTYTFDFGSINYDLIPFSLWAYKTAPMGNSDTVQLQIKDRNTQALIWDLDLTVNRNIQGNSFHYSFPFLCFSTNHLVQILSNSAMDQVVIFGEKTKLNKVITPNY